MIWTLGELGYVVNIEIIVKIDNAHIQYKVPIILSCISGELE